MTESEAFLLLLNNVDDLAAIPQAAWPLLAALFEDGNQPTAFERSIEATIAELIHEPLTVRTVRRAVSAMTNGHLAISPRKTGASSAATNSEVVK